MEERLKSCPFCGHEPMKAGSGVRCSNTICSLCKYQIKYGEEIFLNFTPYEWNHRPTPTPKVKELDKVAFGLANDIQARHSLEIGTVTDIEKMIIEGLLPILANKTGGAQKMIDFIEEQIAFDLEAALIDGGLNPEKYVIDNRKTLRQLVEEAVLTHSVHPVVSVDEIYECLTLTTGVRDTTDGDRKKLATSVHHLLEGKKG